MQGRDANPQNLDLRPVCPPQSLTDGHDAHQCARAITRDGDTIEITGLQISPAGVILQKTGNFGGCLMSIDSRIEANRRQILRIAADHGARNVRVFGSAARGEAGPDSDVDFLVAVQPEHSAWFPAGLIVDLERLLGCEVDVVTEEALHWYIQDHVLKEAIPL